MSTTTEVSAPAPANTSEPRQPATTLIGRDDVTIIVLNWNRRDDTLACLESLASADLGGARVMVVDNGSRDGSVDAIRERYPTTHIVALPQNRGYAGGNNAGMRAALEAGAKAVLLLNNDTVVAPDFLFALIEILNQDPLAAAVSSATLRIDSPEVLHAAYLDIYFGHGLVHRRGVNKLPGEGFDRAMSVEVAIGCSLLIRAEALRTVGFFDESYFAYHEEVDWCFRVRQAGQLIYYQPYSRVWHHGSRSTVHADQKIPARAARADLANPIPLSWNPVRTYLGARNAVRFVRLHGAWKHRLYYIASTLYAVPLEFLAVLMDQEEELMLGKWTYRRAAEIYFIERHEPNQAPGAGNQDQLRRILRGVLRAPLDLLCSLPRDIRRVHRQGRTGQLIEHVRGLWDGLLDRPLPLERLGLR